MTSEEIRKAAEEYANVVCRGSRHKTGLKQFCMVDFMEGAEWYKNHSSQIGVE